ncbi:TonB-dependent receptor [Salegentibacter sp. LM13S]|uniref:SusC/RagA family TonB-linked outer membrane protein n=1 Tax=Salegentibacter lacus TaxID=2873599 RepID=UPI001CCD05F7|nr:TonB-dependent receptor [Salegentibacter lacus]MBZ9630060.1 TonB-dependent receptor [Salegentibacter lacus]
MKQFVFKLMMYTCCVLFSVTGLSQEKQISGTVTDENNIPLPGVNVAIQGTNTGTQTDFDGEYAIAASAGDVLVFSFIGMEETQIQVGAQSVYNVVMMEGNSELDEVVVIGYGSERKRDLTGAVSSISAEDFNPGVAIAPEQLMQGKIAGVNIVQNSGQPGAASTVRIRGTNSVSAGNDPLYVIDGVPLQFGSSNNFVSGMQGSSPFSSQPTNPLNTINPADIASIDVLKDASATAIYGSRGANGVIVITTKDGGGNDIFNYDGFVGVSSVRKTLPFLSADEYRNYANQNGLEFPDEGANTDWQDEIFRTGISQNHNLSFGGGSGNTNYRASVGYTSQEGIILSSGLEKYTARLNADHRALNDRLKIGLNITYGDISEDNAPVSSNINNEGGNLLKDALRWAPTLPVRNEDGSFYQIGELRINPVSWGQVEDIRETDFFLGSGDISYNLTDELTARVNLGLSDENVERYTHMPSTHPSGETDGGRASINKANNYSTLLETTLNYTKSFDNNSNLSVLAGYSFQRFVYDYTFTEANNFVSSGVKWNLIQSGNILANNSFKTANRLESLFGRFNYRLMDSRYLFTVTLRRDGSSRFGENNRYGVFPSGAFAWRISDEEFFSTDFFSNLKLRTGYGITGNQEIPNDLYRQQLTIAGSASYNLGGESIPSVLPSNYANPDLKWEETSQLNVGLDFSMMDERVYGSIDYYQKNTTDLLLQFSTTAPSVVSTQWANVGEVENKGLEIDLNGVLVEKDDFTWNANINWSRNKNEVLSLSNDQFSREEIRTAPLSGVVTPKDFSQIIRPGYPLGTFYGRQFTGYNEEGMETYLDEDGVEGADLVVIGDAQPDFVYGFSSNVRWRNFDASVTFRGVVGNDIMNNTAAEFSYPLSAPGVNVLESAIENTEISRSQTPQISSKWIEDGSYLRLDNLNIGYTLKPGDDSVLKRARFYITGQNLFVITNYSGFDPEVRTNTNAGGTAPIGIDYLAYPRPRIFQLGTSLSF